MVSLTAFYFIIRFARAECKVVSCSEAANWSRRLSDGQRASPDLRFVGTCAFHGVQVKRQSSMTSLRAGQVGCLWELNPTKPSDTTAAHGVWLGGATWSAPRAEQRQFRGQAIPASGGKLVGEGTRSTPRTRQCQGPHQAIPATDGGASRCGEARRRSDVHLVRTMISKVPASRGGCP